MKDYPLIQVSYPRKRITQQIAYRWILRNIKKDPVANKVLARWNETLFIETNFPHGRLKGSRHSPFVRSIHSLRVTRHARKRMGWKPPTPKLFQIEQESYYFSHRVTYADYKY